MGKVMWLRVLLTMIVVVAALVLGRLLWLHYLYSPWTRDGRIRANVVHVAPDVSGLVAGVPVHDNEFVHKGEVLLVIDQARFELALAQARANLLAAEAAARAAGAATEAAAATAAGQRSEAEMLEAEARRRNQPATAKYLSAEDRQDAEDTARSAESALQAARASRGRATASQQQAVAAVQLARVQVAVAQLNLRRSEVRAPADGYITNLTVRVGDYANTGSPLLALVDSDSYYVYGYFEETKLPRIRIGDPVALRLMAGGVRLRGHVAGVARGIVDSNDSAGQGALADVNPNFDWVRLAQRIPVRITIDPASLPKGVDLSAGMTVTLTVHPHPLRPAAMNDKAAQGAAL